MEAKKRLVFSILEFLKQSNEDGTLRPDDAEGIDVAIQCIGEAFSVSPDDPEHVTKYSTKPANLLSIFEVFLNTQKKVAAAKTPATDSTVTAPQAPSPAQEQQGGSTEERKAEAENFKNEGNKKMSAKDYAEAVALYGKAIELNPTNAVYYANRAAAYSQNGDHEKAVEDSQKATQLDSTYSKAYSRLGHACFCLGRYQESVDAFTKGLELDPENATMKNSLTTAKARLEAPASDAVSATESSADAGSGTRSAGGAGAGGMPDLASMLGGGGGGAGGMPDIASLLQNPAMMRMAQQAMQNPEMMRMAQQMMGGGGPGGASGGAGGAGGNPLAGMMNNPEMMNLASQFMNGMGRGGGR